MRRSEQTPIPSSPSTPAGPEVILTKEPQIFIPKTHENSRETGSSGNNIIEVDANQVTHASSTFREDRMEDMALRFRNEFIESEQKPRKACMQT